MKAKKKKPALFRYFVFTFSILFSGLLFTRFIALAIQSLSGGNPVWAAFLHPPTLLFYGALSLLLSGGFCLFLLWRTRK